MDQVGAWLVVFFWGISFIATKKVVQIIDPFSAAFLRFSLAFLFLLPFSRGKLRMKNPHVFLASLWGVFGYFAFENSALVHTAPTNAAIIVSSAPILHLMSSHLFRKKKVNTWMYVGSLLAFAGVALVVLNGRFVLRLNPIGDFLAFGAAVSWVLYTHHIEKLGKVGVPENVAIMFWGALFFLPFFLKSAPSIQFSFELLFPLSYLGIVCSGISYFLWNKAIERIGGEKTTNMIYFIPVVTAISEHVLKRSFPSPVLLLGVFLATSGLFVFRRGELYGGFQVSKTDKLRRKEI